MDALPDEVREKVQRLNAGLVLGLLMPANTVWLACDLLMAGVETPSVIELAGESPTRLTELDAEPLVRQVLLELGVEPVDDERAAWTIVRDAARQMVDGDLPPEDGAATIDGLWWECDTAPELGALYEPLEQWGVTPPEHRDDEAIRAELRRLAVEVVRAADEWFATQGDPDR